MGRFYVYSYLRSIDSERGLAGTSYYIGKGQTGRAFQRNHNIPVPSSKSNILFLASNLSEVDAFQAEMLLIHLYGRIDLGTGYLHNQTDGGNGPSGAIRSEDYKERMRKARIGQRVSRATAEKIKASLVGKKRPPFTEEWKRKLSTSTKTSSNHWSRTPRAKEVIAKIRLGQQSSSAKARSSVARSGPRAAVSEKTRQRMKERDSNRIRVKGRYVK